ncbi:MAG: VWA domain-containing protein [Bacteroidales bacterium]
MTQSQIPEKMIRFILIGFFFISGLGFSAQAQQKPASDPSKKPLTRILFVFDVSQSMYGRWQSDIKINIARNIMYKVLDSLSNTKDLEVALRLYGHQHSYPPQVCNDTKLEVPFARDNFNRIKNRLESVVPKGTSPIAYALQQTANDFPPCDNCRNIIVLITDGIEECGGDPCAASEYLQKNGIALRPFIIGIGTNFEKAFSCVGTYFDASSEMQFNQALNIVVTRALNPTSTQVNLLDAHNRPTETNVNMTFFDNFTGKIRYNFIHTMNSFGLPDTLFIDPLLTYNIVVHTIPPVRVDSIRLNPGMHSIIPVNVPQGFLHLKMNTQSTVLKSLKCIIRRDGSMETINVQDIEHPVKYITGTYHIEVLSLPRLYIDDIKIEQSHTTTVDIPVPGIVVVQKPSRGYGGLYIERDGKLELVHNLRDTGQSQESLVIMPGQYRAVFRSRFHDRSIFTIERSFEIKSGITTNIRLQN